MSIYTRQLPHLILLLALIAGVFFVLDDNMLAGRFFGLSTAAWLGLAIITPILHQVYVWLAWRSELTSQRITRRFGKDGFFYYAAGFTVFLVARLLTIVALAYSNRYTCPLPPVPAYTLGVALFIPALYLFYSVRKHFGFKRAYGIDHFDDSYRRLPFVRQGIFRLTGNAMYVFGFFVLWTPGLFFLSQAALLAAAFNHLYIWVHYYCTELPDIRHIYGQDFGKEYGKDL